MGTEQGKHPGFEAIPVGGTCWMVKRYKTNQTDQDYDEAEIWTSETDPDKVIDLVIARDSWA